MRNLEIWWEMIILPPSNHLFFLSWDLYLQHILYGFSREISFDIERCRSRVDTRESWKLLHIFCIIYYLQTIGWDYVYGKDNLLYWHMWRHACDMAVEWYQKHYILRMRLSGKNPSNCWKFVWLCRLCSNVKYIYLKKSYHRDYSNQSPLKKA